MTPYLEQLTGGPLNGEVYRQTVRQTEYRQTDIQSDRHNMMNPRLNANSNSHLVLYLLAA